MNKILTAILLVALIAFWWNAAAPPDHHPVPGKITFDGQAVENALRVDQSEAFQEERVSISMEEAAQFTVRIDRRPMTISRMSLASSAFISNGGNNSHGTTTV